MNAAVAVLCAGILAGPLGPMVVEEGQAPVEAPGGGEMQLPTASGLINEAAQVQFTEAERLRGEGDFAGSEAALLEVRRLAPDWTPVLFNLALMAGAQGKWAEQAGYLDQYEPHVPEELRPTVRARAQEARRHHSDRAQLASSAKSLGVLGALGLFFGATFTGLGVTAAVISARGLDGDDPSTGRLMMGAGFSVGPVALVGGSFALAGRAKRKRILRASQHPPALSFGPTPTLRIEF